eukprot:GCRY01000605.1.p1 GENE.GCRY01000605.1~~GCRY01000605.1.p1  ORF type:complete len:138 (-),score=17.15 GCRY01000605.1:159-572(-)
MSAVTCTINEEIAKVYKKFRLNSASSAALILKINVKDLEVVIDEEVKDSSLSEIAEDLPISVPRYIVYSYKRTHSDGRVSYPLCFIFYSPSCKLDLAMMYASTKQRVVNLLEISRIFDVRSADELDEDWLLKNLERC